MKNARFCQVLLTKASQRGGSREILSRERAKTIWFFSFGLSGCGASWCGVSPAAVSLLMWGLSWCEVSPGVGPPGVGSPNVVSPNVVNYNDGVSNVKPS